MALVVLTPASKACSARCRGFRFARRQLAVVAAAWAAAVVPRTANAQTVLTGQTGAHDPSTIFLDEGKYYYFATGTDIVSRSSTNEVSWQSGPNVFSTAPAWTSAITGFDGHTMWAPEVTFLNNQYYLYYAISSFGSQVSGIGVATSPTLNPSDSNYGWTDHGPVIQSTTGSSYNTIDPSILQDTDGTEWMSFGSFFGGIYLTQLNPATGLRLSTSVNPTHLANNSSIEASYLYKRNGWYYLFVNFGACCQGVNSTYNIRVGRSQNIRGPYLDQSGVNMLNSGGTLFLGNDSNKIGPGQVGILSQGDLDQFSYHYYDGNANGNPTLGIHTLYWTSDNWPSYTPINPSWAGTTNTSWSTSTNWAGGVPNGKGHTANFVTLSSGNYSVALDTGSKTVGMVNFNSAASYTIGSPGGNSLVMDSTIGNAAINVNQPWKPDNRGARSF